ncbi:MAG: hypothetical protein AB8B72_13305 [Crocinitomicaceae bacterium]
MFFLSFIRRQSLLAITITISSAVVGQQFQTSKYNSEYNPYFKFKKFERGEKSEILSQKLDKLKEKEKTEWNLTDSIEFAEISLLTSNVELSHYYLENVVKQNRFSKKSVLLLVMDCYIENDFKTGKKTIDSHFNMQDLRDQYMSSIFYAHETHQTTGQVDSLIFNISKPNFKTIKKGSEEFKNLILKPLSEATASLRFFVKFIHENDPVLARGFNEIGQLLEYNISINQAYIAYSIARIYNSKDKEILENVKRIKAKHVQKNYNTPKFRTYFPRIEYWRFDYDILKEKIIREKNDTVPRIEPPLYTKNETTKFPFPIDILVPVGISTILLLFLIFTRSRKK